MATRSSKKVSVIIPAYNEGKYLQTALEALKKQSYRPLEILVVVNGSRDNTFQIAKRHADIALNFVEPIGAGAARNRGAERATGDIFLFIDADSRLSPGAVQTIARKTTAAVCGTCLGKPDSKSIRARLFFAIKNTTHRLGLYQGVPDGVLFCHRKLFFKVGGFDEQRRIGEFEVFLARARTAGGRYKLLTQHFALTSVRRFEEKGYLGTVLFWIRWKIKTLFGKGDKEAQSYFEKKK